MDELNQDWGKMASRILKVEIAKQELTYKELAAKLNELGVNYKESDITARLSRGSFSAAFFIQCLKAMGAKNIEL